MKVVEFYARVFGIGDDDLMEAPWLAQWIERHRNQLRYSVAQCRWFWIGDGEMMTAHAHGCPLRHA